jgi:hypothetical protein
MNKKQDISPVQFLLVLVAVLAWGIAGYFAAQEPAKSVEKGIVVAIAPNNVAAAGVLGFSIAGGLCFLGVGIAGLKSGNGQAPPPPPSS